MRTEKPAPAADNINAMNPVVATAMENLDPAPIADLAVKCVRAGASILDINPGYLSQRKIDRMEFLVESVQNVVDVPLILDSPDANVLARGLAVCIKSPILSAVTMEPSKLKKILPLAVENDTDLVALLLDEKSISPSTSEETISIALEIFSRASEAGLSPDRLIFDPVLPSLTWHDSDSYVKGSIETIRMLADGSLLGFPARTMAGLSNLRSGAKKLFPSDIEIQCLETLVAAGLAYPLMNVLNSDLISVIYNINRD